MVDAVSRTPASRSYTRTHARNYLAKRIASAICLYMKTLHEKSRRFGEDGGREKGGTFGTLRGCKRNEKSQAFLPSKVLLVWLDATETRHERRYAFGIEILEHNAHSRLVVGVGRTRMTALSSFTADLTVSRSSSFFRPDRSRSRRMESETRDVETDTTDAISHSST